MIICGYLVDKRRITKLRKIGTKDSKKLSPQKRISLEPELRKLANDVVTLKTSAKQIDVLRSKTNLNKIEINQMQKIINLLEPDAVRIDAPEVNTKRFEQKIMAKVKIGCKITCENFADKKYPEVGAASIIAKVTRDRDIEKLHSRHGFFGSGYTSDTRTVEFLKNWINNNKEFPDFVRKSWITAMLMKEEKEQMRINSFT